jgi:hypothetical protein
MSVLLDFSCSQRGAIRLFDLRVIQIIILALARVFAIIRVSGLSGTIFRIHRGHG